MRCIYDDSVTFEMKSLTHSSHRYQKQYSEGKETFKKNRERFSMCHMMEWSRTVWLTTGSLIHLYFVFFLAPSVPLWDKFPGDHSWRCLWCNPAHSHYHYGSEVLQEKEKGRWLWAARARFQRPNCVVRARELCLLGLVWTLVGCWVDFPGGDD